MEVYHALNRGVEKRNLFLDTQDYARFVHNLYEFNDIQPAANAGRSFGGRKMSDLRNHSFERKPIVDVHGWCLMKNHYHLLLSEKVEGGITKFLRKLNIGYANYFNERYERSGSLFQGRTKRIHVDSEPYYLYILHYIHFNPLDYFPHGKGWRTGERIDAVKSLEYLDGYRWSSYNDYCGKKNFPSVLTTSLFSDDTDASRSASRRYLEDIELDPVRSYLLE